MSDELTKKLTSGTSPIESVVRIVAHELAVAHSTLSGDRLYEFSDAEIKKAADRLVTGGHKQEPKSIATLDVDTLTLAMTLAGRFGGKDSIAQGLTPAGYPED